MIRKIITSAFLLSLMSGVAFSQDNATTFDPSSKDNGFVYEEEIVTDFDFFIRNGYEAPDYDKHYGLRDEVKKNLVDPDYKKRTGKEPPESGLVIVAPAYITGGDFNDIIVWSHLPGDCKLNGCLVQVYSTSDAKNWSKKLEFTAYSVVYKPPVENKAGQIVAVGNVNFPNRYFYWMTDAFVEGK